MVLGPIQEVVDGRTGEVTELGKPVRPSDYKCPQTGALLPSRTRTTGSIRRAIPDDPALCTTDGRWRFADGIASGTVEFKPGRFEGGGMVFLRFRAWVQEVDETAGGIGAVYFEEVRFHHGATAAHAYGGYVAHLTAWAEMPTIPYRGVPVATIKRHVTCKGNAERRRSSRRSRHSGSIQSTTMRPTLWHCSTGRSSMEAGNERPRPSRTRRRPGQPAPTGVGEPVDLFERVARRWS